MSFGRGSLLAIDAGNTRTKWALFDATGAISSPSVCANADLASAQFLPTSTSCKQAFISNVVGAEVAQLLTAKCQALGLTITWTKSTSLACGVKSNYDHPSQLGTDRWAALIAAWSIYQTPCIVVDLGTAVTIDALAPNHHGAEFLGGLILPGLRLLQQTLLNGTHGIASSVVNISGKATNFPTNTADAVHTGACLAIIGAIVEVTTRLQKHIGGGTQTTIVLTGGDAVLLMPLLADKFNTDSVKRVFVRDNLVLQGLYLLEREQE